MSYILSWKKSGCALHEDPVGNVVTPLVTVQAAAIAVLFMPISNKNNIKTFFFINQSRD